MGFLATPTSPEVDSKTSPCSSMEEHRSSNPQVVGSSPTGGAMKIIQLGANTGNDSFFRALEYLNLDIELLVLVEPMEMHLETLSNCYKDYDNVVIKNVAIKSRKEGPDELTIYYHVNDGPLYHVASFNPTHVRQYYPYGLLEQIVVPCVTVEQLIQSLELDSVDWLLIDVEALDAEILLNFDPTPYNIKRIDIEHLHLGNKMQQVLDKFAEWGYTRTDSTNGFDWAFELPSNTIKTRVE